MRIEPTGVLLMDVCSIQTERCVAKETAPITAVWTLPGRVQVNVCRPCLEEQVRAGLWEIEGAKVEGRADVAVYSPDKKLALIVEVKKTPDQRINLRDWAKRIHRNLLAHGGIPGSPYFLVAILPDKLYLWKESSPSDLDQAPDYEVEAKKILQRYFDLLSTSAEDASSYQLETLVSLWLKDVVHSEPSDVDSMKWFYDSGLYEATKEGSVVTEASVAA